jgi:hypothetical protein
VRFEAADLSFKSVKPALSLDGCERLVYRISSTNGGDDERVLLRILSSLDKAYSAKYEKQLEEARADLLSSSMSFQVIADEVRAGQAAAEKRWEREVKSLKEQMSTNQKRCVAAAARAHAMPPPHPPPCPPPPWHSPCLPSMLLLMHSTCTPRLCPPHLLPC